MRLTVTLFRATLPLLVLLAGCGKFKEHQSEFTFCDWSGCYTCNESGCNGVGSGGGWNGCDDWGDHCTGSCFTDSDCASGTFCQIDNGVCVPSRTCSPFATDEDCGPGMICDGRNTCVPGPSACSTNNDCATGCYCQNGNCEETGLCVADTDCSTYGDNFVCASGTCVPGGAGQCLSNTNCPSGEACVDGTCRPDGSVSGCTKDEQCGAGGKCVSGLCQTGCAGGEPCGTGAACNGATCVTSLPPTNACVHNADCNAGNTCVNGFCHPGCASNADCTNGDVCNASICGPNTQRQAQCHANADCQAGLECVDALCRAACYTNADCSLCGPGGTTAGTCLDGYCE